MWAAPHGAWPDSNEAVILKVGEAGQWQPFAGGRPGRGATVERVPSPLEDTNRRMLRARDAMDRRFAEPLDVPALAGIAHLSASRFSRVFKDTFGEAPHRYLQRRRVERAMTLLRQTERPVTQVAWDVGFESLGTFSRTFSSIVGCTPSEFRALHEPVDVPSCFIASWTRPREGTVVSEKRTRLGGP